MDGQVLMNSEALVTQEYCSSHKAIDVVGAGHSITDVIAISDGTVEIAVSTVTANNTKARGTASYGNFVKIKHDDGTKSLYAHLKPGSVSVKAGDRINKGDKIGTMGETGNAEGIHLHFEIRNSDETRINPKDYFDSLKQEETVSSSVSDNTVDNSGEVDSNDLNIPVDNSLTDEFGSSENESITTDPIVTDDSLEEASEIHFEQGKDYTSNSNASKEITYLDNHDYKYGSIVDGLKEIGIDSSYDYRSILALENGIDDYHGSYDQNVYLLSLLKQGKLKKV